MEITSEKADELVHQGYEAPDLDYKLDFDQSTRAWMEVAKDAYGMANYGGGHIVFGVRDATFEPIGFDEAFHIDTQTWADKLSKWLPSKLNITYAEHEMKINGNTRVFPILHVHGTIASLAIPKDDGVYQKNGKTEVAFRRGVTYTRQNTSTIAATGEEFWKLFWALLKRTAERTGSLETPLEVLSVLNKKTEPDQIEETLWFNLFPVLEIPDNIYSAETKFRMPLDIFGEIERVAKSAGTTPAPTPTFLLSDKKLYSFSPFDQDNPLTLCVNSTQETISTKTWLIDKTKQQKLVMLLNYHLKDLCGRKGIRYDRKRDRYFVKYAVGAPVPEVTWKPYKSTATRQLVNLKLDKTGKLLYCEHFSARMRFVVLGDGIYLIIEPTRVLTRDGEEPLDQKLKVRISTAKNVFYHNNNYLYDMKLWLHILGGNRDEIHLGRDQGKIVVSVRSLTSRVNFGVMDDQHTGGDFLDQLKSEPFDYLISNEEVEDENPLTETSLED